MPAKLIAESTAETAARYVAGPGGFVYTMQYVKAVCPDATAEEVKAKGGYGYTHNLIIRGTLDGRRLALGAACRTMADAYKSAAERLGWSEQMTPPRTKAGDLFVFPTGVVCRVHRAYWHRTYGKWIVEFYANPSGSATPNLSWQPESDFLRDAAPYTEGAA